MIEPLREGRVNKGGRNRTFQDTNRPPAPTILTRPIAQELEARVKELEDENHALKDAAENLLIGLGMGWDTTGMEERLLAATGAIVLDKGIDMVTLENGEITIRINADQLQMATESTPELSCQHPDFDKAKWLKAVFDEMSVEDNDCLSLIAKLIDDAIHGAMERARQYAVGF